VRRCSEPEPRERAQRRATAWPGALRASCVFIALASAACNIGAASQALAERGPACRGTVYLTLDTGNMRDAELIAATLARHQVRATFFLANERTPRGDFALDDGWAQYWRDRVAEGHAFGNHTYDHVYFRAEQRGGAIALARPQFGADAGRSLRWDGRALCAELARVQRRFATITGRKLDPLWRAPGGKAPAAVIEQARACGYAHVHWARAGFLGDELPSETYPNARLLEGALRDIRDGDILMAHLGIWSRKDPWAPTLDPLIAGLKARGLCFATIAEHPAYRVVRARSEPSQ
jgi:peptidoglycan/xylan/chitin deacetylase (PgdA/CDA1 family)